MRTGELAKLSGVNLETIRYYERVGVLQPPPRKANGYRAYGALHLQRLVFLRRCRQLGFSVREAQELLRLSGTTDQVCEDVNRLATTHLAAVREKARELQRLQKALQGLVDSCTKTKCASRCSILHSLGDSAVTP